VTNGTSTAQIDHIRRYGKRFLNWLDVFLLPPLACGRFFRLWHLLIRTGTVVVPVRNRQLMEPLMPTDTADPPLFTALRSLTKSKHGNEFQSIPQQHCNHRNHHHQHQGCQLDRFFELDCFIALAATI